ncbi:MAG: 50S ribosomal protein L29 [Deltaproteobacteria bacterium]|nr:50S ribosomal protein L29 [Deltaproteobacteria bacterium]
MIAREIRQRSNEELLGLAASLTDDLFQYRMQNASGQPDMGRIRKTRRDLARVKTVMSERGMHSDAIRPPAEAEEGEEQ